MDKKEGIKFKGILLNFLSFFDEIFQLFMKMGLKIFAFYTVDAYWVFHDWFAGCIVVSKWEVNENMMRKNGKNQVLQNVKKLQ